MTAATLQASDARAAPRWLSDPGWFAVIPVVSVLTIIAGIGIVAFALHRERPDEILPGITIVLVALALMSWAMTRRSPALGVIVTVGALVQVSAVAWYYYSGFAVDANTYHRAAVAALAGDPVFEWSTRNWANWMMATLTASLYRVTGVSQLMGFVAFSSVGFLGKAIFARTLLRLHPLLGRAADAAAIAAMTFPSLALWLAPISKEAFAVLGVALVIAGLARPVGARPRVLLLVLGLASAALTRPHVSLLLAISALVFAAATLASGHQSILRRTSLLAAVVLLGYAALATASEYFGVEPTAAGFEDVRLGLAQREVDGGSTIETRPVRSPLDVPAATANVLLRPHLGEAQGVTQSVQALENTLLGLGLMWLLLQYRRRRDHPVVGAAAHHLRAIRAFAWSYVLLFVYSFSGMYNLGLMSRQRTQVILVILLLAATALRSARRLKEPISPTRSSASAGQAG